MKMSSRSTYVRTAPNDTEIYGKQEARKGTLQHNSGVKIEVLPPILMIQLKRFEFSPLTYQNEKLRLATIEMKGAAKLTKIVTYCLTNK